MGEYRDYAAKVAAAMGTPEISDELVREHQATGIADYLCSERNRQGLSQRDIAKRMGVSASRKSSTCFCAVNCPRASIWPPSWRISISSASC